MIIGLNRVMDMTQERRRAPQLVGLTSAVLIASFLTAGVARAQEPAAPAIPEVSLRFANAAFLDQSEAIIGIRKGWFEDVGITLEPEPHGLVLPSAERAANLIAGTVDVVATGAYNLLPSMGRARNLRVFFQKDVFQGYRIMAQPEQGYKSFDEFLAEGLSEEEAFQRTAAQLKGKTITYLSEPSREQFIEMIYRRGGLTQEEIASIQTINVDDSQTIGMMISGRADFQFSGAPAMVELTKRGFKSILTAVDLARSATPSVESSELLASQKVGWATTSEFMEANHDTILRMASVGFRIVRYIRDNPEEALEIHVPFLNSIAGSQMTSEFGKWLYDVVHPYSTFEEQWEWYADPRSVFYYWYEVGARIKDAEAKGIFSPGDMRVETIMAADDVYWELLELKLKAGRAINQANRRVEDVRAAGKDASKADELLDRAGFFFSAYDYLDAHRFAEAALAWADHAAKE